VKLNHFLVFIGLVLFLAGCQEAEDDISEINLESKVSFSATIIETSDTSILVTPTEGEAELQSADQIYVSVSDTTSILDENANDIEGSDLQEGMIIEILYNGMIAESYPAQIHTCYEIKIEDEAT